MTAPSHRERRSFSKSMLCALDVIQLIGFADACDGSCHISHQTGFLALFYLLLVSATVLIEPGLPTSNPGDPRRNLPGYTLHFVLNMLGNGERKEKKKFHSSETKNKMKNLHQGTHVQCGCKYVRAITKVLFFTSCVRKNIIYCSPKSFPHGCQLSSQTRFEVKTFPVE